MNKSPGSTAAPAAGLITIAGPTGSGKSDLSLTLAQAVGGEIVNFDSVQLYQGFDIGSAKLTAAERRGIPHHLLDVAEGNHDVTAGSFARLAETAVREIASRGNVPVLVGGTGLYLRALLDGLSPAPERDELLRKRLADIARRHPSALHRYLRRFDSAGALRIHPNDSQKLIRAVEMTRLTQRPASALQAAARRGLQGFAVLKLGLAPDRGLLRERIDGRAAWMFGNGLLEETATLLQSGLRPDAKALQSLGYKQAAAVLLGAMPVAEAVRECQVRTRQYAKRQMTWFRRERDMRWFEGFGSEPGVQGNALTLVQQFLAGLERKKT